MVQPWGRVLVPPQGIYITVSLTSSAETKSPTQVEDGNFRMSARFLEHHPVTSPPTNQKKLTTCSLHPKFDFKTVSPKTIREFGVFEHESPVLLAWPCNKLSLLQTLTFWFVWPFCVSGTRTCVQKHHTSITLHCHRAQVCSDACYLYIPRV